MIAGYPGTQLPGSEIPRPFGPNELPNGRGTSTV
jgi:hypothetical protein